MGYDYRGGGIEADPHMAQAIRVIRAGETPRQRNRALLDKAILAGVGAALTGGAGVLHAGQSNSLQEEQAAKAKADREATEDSATRRSAQQYASPDYVAPTDVDHTRDIPAWLSQAQGVPLEDQAKEARDTQDLNMQAAGANIGGYRTPTGLEDADGESDVRAADISTGKNLMRTGGMMNSLARTR